MTPWPRPLFHAGENWKKKHSSQKCSLSDPQHTPPRGDLRAAAGAPCPLPVLPCHQSYKNRESKTFISTAGAEAVPGLGLKASASQSGSCSTYWPFAEHIPTLGNTKQGSKSSGKRQVQTRANFTHRLWVTSECGERSDAESWQEGTGAQTFRQQGSGPFPVTCLGGVSN